MHSKNTRLDRFLSTKTGINKRDIRLILAQGRVTVDGLPATETQQIIGQFTHITLDNQILQSNTPLYIMMNKPQGVVSATKDTKHKTVIDLLDDDNKNQLHIVGRLDFNSTGLLLLTNDGEWSRELNAPENKVTKTYRVTLQAPITKEIITAFNEGMYFSFEAITTRPATLTSINTTIPNDTVVEVNLTEGRYHQIKRMFGRFQNKVLALHRTKVGNLPLDLTLKPGQSRHLTPEEVQNISSPDLHEK